MKNGNEEGKKLRDQRGKLASRLGAGGNLLKASLIEATYRLYKAGVPLCSWPTNMDPTCMFQYSTGKNRNRSMCPRACSKR